MNPTTSSARARRLLLPLGLALFCVSLAPATGSAQSPNPLRPASASAPDDREAVRAAVLDYVEALYQIAPSRIERSVHPRLAKTGFCCTADAPAYREALMTYEQLHALAGRWNRDGRADPRTAVKEIVVFDVLDQTATAKLTAQWGVDYLHLARYDGRWKIVNVLWQSPPPRP